MSEKARISMIIKGQVQGVFFRYETKKEAERLGLTGLVKNNNDGNVEILAEGDKNKLEELAKWCKSGPDSAQVENVEIKWQEYNGRFEGFEIS